VQLAAVRDATVAAVCSTRNIDLVASLGAAEVVDYTREDFTRAGRSYDVVLDLIGNADLTLANTGTNTGRPVLS
jgi:NADPH:quinone reductase-like Zn-dependent oxidoreductase